MLKTLAGCIREYKRPAILTLLLMVGEALIETLIPFITAEYLINRIQTEGENLDMMHIVKVGILLIAMAFCSLLCGGLGGFTCSRAAAGFAKNLRHDIFDRVQSFSFENIDRFSTSSLVTRITTDVANVQMSYMMLIRTAVRSPLISSL